MTKSIFNEPSGSDRLPENVVPVGIVRQGESAIMIAWSDGMETAWTAAQLRNRCPCATCREKKRGEQKKRAEKGKQFTVLPVLTDSEARPLRIESMKPVGSYAYNITFSDGHSSGIFAMALLRGSGPNP